MQTSHPNSTTGRRGGGRRPGRGFTLVELMISIALALMLIYGISQVFKLSGDTIGANTAIGHMTRDSRAAQATLTEDFRNSLFDSPLFLISNRIAYGYVAGAPGSGFKAGFKNAEDEREEGATNADPLGAVNINGSLVLPPGIASGSDRAPRLDRMGFFVRNLYRRQTAASNQVSSGVTSTDAYVWYGHVALPPAVATDPWIQPHNQYAADRVLGRMTILMKSSGTTYSAGEDYIRWPSATPPADMNFRATRLWPLGWSTAETNENNLRQPTNTAAAYQSVKDLAPVSVDEWRAYADAAYTASPFAWFRPMEDYNPAAGQFWRAYCRPTVSRPIDQVKMSQTAPYFVGNCTQFIVEYAGDFLNQTENDPNVPGIATDVIAKMNPNSQATTNKGAITYGQTDGKLDYIIDTSGDGTFDQNNNFRPNDPPSNAEKWVRRTRWYGLPRDVTGDGAITINDVLPLSDVMQYYKITMAGPNADPADPGRNTRAIAPWEIDLPNMTQPDEERASTRQGLLDTRLTNRSLVRRQNEEFSQQDYALIANSEASRFLYTAAFHNDAPAMIRVTMKLDDPTGRLRDGQWFQFILTR